MMTRSTLLGALLLSLAATACTTSADAPGAPGSAGGKSDDGAAAPYAILDTGEDGQRYLVPVGGGALLCGDGAPAARCLVEEFDLRALDLDADTQSAARAALDEAHVLVRGAFRPEVEGAFTYRATELWVGMTDLAPGDELRLVRAAQACADDACQGYEGIALDDPRDVIGLDGLHFQTLPALPEQKAYADLLLQGEGVIASLIDDGTSVPGVDQIYTRLTRRAFDGCEIQCGGLICADGAEPVDCALIGEGEAEIADACTLTYGLCGETPAGACGWLPTDAVGVCVGE